jgi:TolA-binding protein
MLGILGLLALTGCGKTATAPPVETDAEKASRVFAMAEDFEKARKIKQAVAAYEQVVRYFPDSPESKTAVQRLHKIQRDAISHSASQRRP